MKFGLGVNVNDTITDVVKKSVEAERLGIDYIWVSDVPEQRYAPVVASAIAANTKRVRIGLGLLSPFLHTPAQIANSLITLIEAYGERFELCIGPGDRNQLKSVGVTLSNPLGLEEYLLQARNNIRKALTKHDIRCRIWLGAQGPKTLRIARFFDGVLLNYGHPSLIRWGVGRIGKAVKSYRYGVYALSYVYVDLDPKLYELVRVSSALVALGASKAVQRKLGIYERAVEIDRRLGSNSSRGTESVPNGFSVSAVNYFSIFKSSIELGRYLSELSRMKISHVVFGYPQSHSEKTIRDLMGALKSASS